MGSCFCVHFLNDLEGKKSKSDQSWIKSLNEQSNLLVWVWFYIKESIMPLICRLVAIVPWGNVVFLCYLFFYIAILYPSLSLVYLDVCYVNHYFSMLLLFLFVFAGGGGRHGFQILRLY